MAHDLQIKPARRSAGYGLAFAAGALMILSGAAMAQGATPKASSKAAPKAVSPALPKGTDPKAGGGERPTNSLVTPDGQLLLVPGRRLTVDLQEGAPALAGETRAPADPILAANPNASPRDWVALDPTQLPRDQDLVVFTLYVDPARGSKLVIANGTRTPVIYAATLLITKGGIAAPLPVNTCAVPPGGTAVEYWAGLQVDAILAPRIAASPSPICFDPAADRFYAPGATPPSQQAAAPAPASAPPAP